MKLRDCARDAALPCQTDGDTWCQVCLPCLAYDALGEIAPDLALLVVTLSGELKYLTGMLADGAVPSGADMVNALDALADVEKL